VRRFCLIIYPKKNNPANFELRILQGISITYHQLNLCNMEDT